MVPDQTQIKHPKQVPPLPLLAHAKKVGLGRFPFGRLQTFHAPYPDQNPLGVAGAAPDGLCFAFGIVAGLTQALHVAIVIHTTFCQRFDVITLCG
jgi:hypothetical protein